MLPCLLPRTSGIQKGWDRGRATCEPPGLVPLPGTRTSPSRSSPHCVTVSVPKFFVKVFVAAATSIDTATMLSQSGSLLRQAMPMLAQVATAARHYQPIYDVGACALSSQQQLRGVFVKAVIDGCAKAFPSTVCLRSPKQQL